jgi:hypothetical protein
MKTPSTPHVRALTSRASTRHIQGMPVRRRAPWSAGQEYAIDADYVVYRLEEAGATLLALPGSGWTTRLKTSSIEIVRTALEAYGWEAAKIRPAVPSAENIDRMDEA